MSLIPVQLRPSQHCDTSVRADTSAKSMLNSGMSSLQEDLAKSEGVRMLRASLELERRATAHFHWMLLQVPVANHRCGATCAYLMDRTLAIDCFACESFGIYLAR